MSNTNGGRLAWLRLNAYGVVLACLAIMPLTDLLHPGVRAATPTGR